MPLLLPAPELQFCDADGHPFAGGTINFYVPGTDTAKDTWQDHLGTVLNTNPVVLDSAGRAIIFGNGEYRAVLRDAAGNLIWDQWTSSVISDAMQPVVMAATIADARRLLGIDDAIQAEIDRAEAAEAVLQNEITAETARAEAAETALQDALNAEIARAEAAEANLQSQISAAQKIQSGFVSTSSSGTASVTFATAYTEPPVVVVTQAGTTMAATWFVVNSSTSGFDVWASSPRAGDTLVGVPVGVVWMAVGT